MIVQMLEERFLILFFVILFSEVVFHGVPPTGWQLLRFEGGGFDALNKGLEDLDK